MLLVLGFRRYQSFIALRVIAIEFKSFSAFPFTLNHRSLELHHDTALFLTVVRR